MNTAQRLREEIAGIGYSAIMPDYVFSDVFASPPRDRTASYAVFTHTPPSYRNAALAVVADPQGRTVEEIASEFRALGAPLLFVIEGEEVTAWQVRTEAGPRVVARAQQDQLGALFLERREAWAPRSIQQAKSARLIDRALQLDFVDAGLMPAIEAELHPKLDRLLQDTIYEAVRAQSGVHRIDEQTLFRPIFRFLAAKILEDGSHTLAQEWDPARIETILDAISRYYNLPNIDVQPNSFEHETFTTAWSRLRNGINFQNISVDVLAFIYENTLVTPETRKRLGTHSTPWQVAEYVVSRLGLEQHPADTLSIYEPCAGAAVFLISALRNLRESLPTEWDDERKHAFLIQRLFGDEYDAFAVEVARLSLILADYPNHNGWQVNQIDIFQKDVLQRRLKQHNVVVCNPPFEAFEPEDRARYAIAGSTHLKSVAVLNAALDRHPLALGFVMPRAFIVGQQFASERSRLARLYGAVEIVHLPDRTFRESEDGAALVIAREPRPPAPAVISLRSSEVQDRDRERFLRTGAGVVTRELQRPVGPDEGGELWIPRLGAIWAYLGRVPRLGRHFTPSWGLQWNYDQSSAYSLEPRPGYVRGVHNVRGSKQFLMPRVVYLDYRPGQVRRGYGQPWTLPKLIINAGRRGRAAWRVSAFVDTSGLAYSQQFFGLWPTRNMSERELFAWAAVMNGPVASAYLASHSSERIFRLPVIKDIPVPTDLPDSVAELVQEYILRCETPNRDVDAERALLDRIDAEVLQAYDLPPRLERELLEFFRGSARKVPFAWHHWFPDDFQPFIPLHEYLTEEYRRATTPWIQNVFAPLPADEAAGLREHMD